LAVLKCVKIRELYEFFKIRKMRILELCRILIMQGCWNGFENLGFERF